MSNAGRLLYEGLVTAWDGFWMVWLSNILWLVLCLPVVTAPLAFAGLYYCAHGLVYGEPSMSWRCFFVGIKRYFGPALRWGGLNLLVLFTVAFYTWFFSPARGDITRAWHSLAGGLLIPLLLIWCVLNFYTFPFMLIQEKPSYMNALRNSLVLFLRWPGVALGFTLFSLAILALSAWLRFPWLVLGGSLPALMACQCVKYASEQTPGK